MIFKKSPLNTIQLLWVNLIIGIFAAYALFTETPSKELLLKKPIGRKENMITPIMWRNIIG